LELSGFGANVAIGSGYVVTRSVQYNSDPNIQTVDVFRATDGTFVRSIPVLLGDVASGISAIHSLAIDAGRLLVGSSGINYGASQEAQLFDLETGHLLQSFSLPARGRGFGFALDLQGPWAVIGDPVDDRAYVFDTTSGGLVKTLVPDGPQVEFIRFGNDLALDGDRLAIADRSRNSVSVYDTTTWTLQRTITKTLGDATNWFGASIDLEGDILVVGAMAYDSFGPRTGGAFVYHLNDDSEIELVPQELEGHVYGMDVALYGNKVAVGGTAGSWDILRYGSIAVFDALSGSDLARILHPEPNWATSWGWSLDIDEQGRLAIGDFLQRFDDEGTARHHDRAGSLYIYQIPEPSLAALAVGAFAIIAQGRSTGVGRGALRRFKPET
jgi:hypothetical protein